MGIGRFNECTVKVLCQVGVGVNVFVCPVAFADQIMFVYLNGTSNASFLGKKGCIASWILYLTNVASHQKQRTHKEY